MAAYDFKEPTMVPVQNSVHDGTYRPPMYRLHRRNKKTKWELEREAKAAFYGDANFCPDDGAGGLNDRFGQDHKVKLMFCIREFTIERTATGQGLHYFMPFQSRIAPDRIINKLAS